VFHLKLSKQGCQNHDELVHNLLGDDYDSPYTCAAPEHAKNKYKTINAVVSEYYFKVFILATRSSVYMKAKSD
jgi:hypothetical protein